MPGWVVARSFEHQMLEEVCDPGFSNWVVRRTVSVPDHMCRDRPAMVADDDDVHAVAQSASEDPVRGCLVFLSNRRIELEVF